MQFLVLEIAVDGIDAEVWLNDVPIIRRGPTLGRFAAVQVNELVADGSNELAIVLGCGTTPGTSVRGDRARAAVDVKGCSVKAKLSRYPHGAVTGGPDGTVLLSLEWIGGERPVVLPRVETVRGEIATGLGQWAHEAAPPIALDAASTAGITTLLGMIRTGLVGGDPEPLITHSQVRIDEIEAAYELDEGEKTFQIRRVTTDDASQPWWGVHPIDASQFDFRRCGRGRLVQVIQRDWEPPLREHTAADGGSSAYPMFVARLDDAWHVVR